MKNQALTSFSFNCLLNWDSSAAFLFHIWPYYFWRVLTVLLQKMLQIGFVCCFLRIRFRVCVSGMHIQKWGCAPLRASCQTTQDVSSCHYAFSIGLIFKVIANSQINKSQVKRGWKSELSCCGHHRTRELTLELRTSQGKR